MLILLAYHHSMAYRYAHGLCADNQCLLEFVVAQLVELALRLEFVLLVEIGRAHV